MALGLAEGGEGCSHGAHDRAARERDDGYRSLKGPEKASHTEMTNFLRPGEKFHRGEGDPRGECPPRLSTDF